MRGDIIDQAAQQNFEYIALPLKKKHVKCRSCQEMQISFVNRERLMLLDFLAFWLKTKAQEHFER